MARILCWLLVWASLPALAWGLDLRPAEAPPADFPARQYVDSRGCVFLRDDAGRWQARVARDGAPICGYPPSSSIRGANGKSRLRALDPDAGKSRGDLLQQALAQAVFPNLRPGELVSDPLPWQQAPDMGPEPMATEPLDTLRASLRAAPALREGMGRKLQPNRRLCALLGYDGHPASPAREHDPTSGYCGAAPASDLSRLAVIRPVGLNAAAPPAAPANVRRGEAGFRKQGIGVASARVAKPQPGRSAIPGVGMIPASARYVGLGEFPAGPEAEAATRRVAALGYPVQRDRSRGAARPDLLAGPFETREAIVRALDRLRRNGFPGARPR